MSIENTYDYNITIQSLINQGLIIESLTNSVEIKAREMNSHKNPTFMIGHLKCIQDHCQKMEDICNDLIEAIETDSRYNKPSDPRYNLPKDVTNKQILRLRKEGYTVYQIAHALGISIDEVFSRCAVESNE